MNGIAVRPAVAERAPDAVGLTADEARRRLAAVGPNEIATRRRGAGLVELASVLGNPLVLILLGAALVSAVLGEVVNAAIIVLMVALSTALNVAQTSRSHRAAERLRQIVTPTATVVREGIPREVPRRDVVPGDVIRLVAGDRIPADARLVEAHDLHVQQAALTGESMPVEKRAGAPDDAALVYFGTSVVSGTATAVVMATGGATQFGDIAARLAERPPETEFERGTRRFALFIMRTVVLLTLFVLLASAGLGRPFFESLLFAVALAVGLTPEFLPMITAVTLAHGAVHMARRKVIVKHLAAIEDFGSIDVLCCDKTGTLTSGEMALDGCVDLAGRPAETVFRLVYLNSANETGIKSPLDAAVLAHPRPPVDGYRKLDEIPFDFERRCISVVVDTPDGGRLLVTKGAPESVLRRCRAHDLDGIRGQLDDDARARAIATYQALSAAGTRVLAVAYRPVAGAPPYTAADERELVLAGFAVFTDPIKPDVRAALETLARDGIAVKLITGDNELVAAHVCRAVGLDAGRIVLGDELDRMGDAALAAIAERVHVFARVSPSQKHRIILALKSRDHVVGFLGDGINDALPLHAADVGISVANAVDVARDAADFVLLERNLAVLHEGILEGRRAFGNVMKYVLMGTSSNFGNMMSMAGAIVFLPFLPMRPTQILLNNFLYDLAEAAIPTDRVDASYVVKPQRWDAGLIRKFMLVIGPLSSLYDFVTFFALLHVFRADESLFQTGWFVESLATQTLVVFVIRTAGSPFRSRPSLALAATTLAVVAVALALPFTPAAALLGFVPLPGVFFVFLTAVTVMYLALVEVVKRRLFAPRMEAA
jgi:Mg2+-importing ATPase